MVRPRTLRRTTEKRPCLIRYPCCLCGDPIYRAQDLRYHTSHLHGWILPARRQGHPGPPSTRYEFDSNRYARHDVIRDACVSYWH